MKSMASLSVYVAHKEYNDVVAFENRVTDALFEKYGLQISLAPAKEQGHYGLLHCILQVNFDHDIASRNAGRKPKPGQISIEEALTMKENNSDTNEIIKRMGVSRATYYRRRKAFLQTGHNP